MIAKARKDTQPATTLGRLFGVVERLKLVNGIFCHLARHQCQFPLATVSGIPLSGIRYPSMLVSCSQVGQ